MTKNILYYLFGINLYCVQFYFNRRTNPHHIPACSICVYSHDATRALHRATRKLYKQGTLLIGCKNVHIEVI